MRFDAIPVRCMLFAMVAVGAWAQTTDRVPLKNWTAPNYWQPSTPAEISSAKEAETSVSRLPHPEMSTTGTGTVSVYVAITPCRLVDTRSNMPTPYGSGSSTAMMRGPASQHTIPATGLASGSYNTTNPCVGLPAAMAYSANITVWPQSPMTTSNKWLSVCPTGTSTAMCSATAALTWYESGTAGTAAAIVANANVIPANASGSFDVYVTDNTWVIIDINGYYTSPSMLALATGSASAPALTFGSDTTSGVYSSAAQAGGPSISIATGGAEQVRVNAAGVSTAGSFSTLGNLDFAGSITQTGAALLRSSTGNGSLFLGLGANGSLTPAGNTGVGPNALNRTTGTDNVAVGRNSLYSLGGGIQNVAVGSFAATSTTTSNENTAVGYNSLESNQTGAANTAVGAYALQQNTVGNETAVGDHALTSNTSGVGNTAVGYNALSKNTIAADNTAVGNSALLSTTANDNTAVGSYAGYGITTGAMNTFLGFEAGNNPITGGYNVGVGDHAIWNITSGSYNTALGSGAGTGLVGNSSYNIDIGNPGAYGESSAIRIGTTYNSTNQTGQNATYIAGIYGAALSGYQYVIVDSTGHLGSVSSSRRFKQDIRDMGETTAAIMGLRPVRFRYKALGAASEERFGLIAEEVNEVAPELVSRDKDGQIDSVYYDKVNAMLLNEVQKQHRTIETQNEAIHRLEARLAELESRGK